VQAGRWYPILIVDDVEETRSVLRRVPQLRGYPTAKRPAGAAFAICAKADARGSSS
jgi:CheY-like chemotaxis protein